MLKTTFICLVLCFYSIVMIGQTRIKGTYTTVPYAIEEPWIDSDNDSIFNDVGKPKSYVDVIILKSFHKSTFSYGMNIFGDIEGRWEMFNDTLVIIQTAPATDEEWVLKFIYKDKKLIPLDGSMKTYYRRKKGIFF